MSADPELSIVIPVYNEAAIVEGSLRELDARLKRLHKRFEILVVENGSKDETAEIVRTVAAELENVKLIQTGQPNYGLALRTGIKAAKSEYIHTDEIDICDVDFHRRATELLHGEDGGFDMVVGSKTMHGAQDHRPFGRRMATRVINGMLRVSLGFKGTDTHGLKAFRRSSVLPIVDQCVVDKDMFASELVIRTERAGLRKVEIPLTIDEKRAPSIQLGKRVPRVLKNVGQLVYVIRFKGQ